ncbi:MAG: hypothetical protein BV457_00055 [Thermoplasmata archaeon M9B1D]|nr:MAG: hypothetical protein BV457_00055 [Thermoplasmata archaeon M9B1D]PNX52243.1 MAG: hypothetical protein BV456_00240 [Thermoplasmata archaeon M8B2D]
MKEFIIKGTRDFTELEDEIGIRKAKIFTETGIEPFVVIIKSIEAWKTNKQNKCFHSLLNLFFRSGCFSQQANNVDELKNYYKNKIGLIKCYLYFNGEKMIKVKEKNEIPAHYPQRARFKILDSWSNATKKQARDGIDLLIAEMKMSGIEQTSYCKEFNEIIKKLE